MAASTIWLSFNYPCLKYHCRSGARDTTSAPFPSSRIRCAASAWRSTDPEPRSHPGRVEAPVWTLTDLVLQPMPSWGFYELPGAKRTVGPRREGAGLCREGVLREWSNAGSLEIRCPSHGGPRVRIQLPPANSPSLARFLFPVSKSRQLPRLRGPGQAARPAETRRARQHHANCR
jgi:hypothetical protein